MSIPSIGESLGGVDKIGDGDKEKQQALIV